MQGTLSRGFAVDLRRVLLLALAGLAVLWGCGELYMAATSGPAGGDFALYQGAAHRWLAGGGFYPAYEMAGPYDPLGQGANPPILYPPVALLLFVPSLVLPAVLWWMIPLGIVAATVAYWRPAPWAYLLIGLCVAYVPTIDTVFAGNPGMWIAAFVALGTRWPAASALVLLKPSLAPFALLGIRTRRWWLVVAGLALVSLAMLPMDLDWLRATLNAQGSRSGLLYSLREVPMDLIPVVAYLGRSRLRDAVHADRARRDVAA